MDTSTLTFDAVASAPGLTLTVAFDQETVFDGPVDGNVVHVKHQFKDDSDLDHLLEITMQGKTARDTQVDEHGNIVSDVTLTISNIALDDIVLSSSLLANCNYHHNFNGSQPDIIDEFHGIMGCNGTVKIPFKSPIYIWLLENMA